MYQKEQIPNPQIQSKEDDIILDVFKWLFFAFALILALIAIKYSLIASIIFVLIALILCPSLKTFLANRIPILKRRVLKGIVLSFLAILSFALFANEMPISNLQRMGSKASHIQVKESKKVFAAYSENVLVRTGALSQKDKATRVEVIQQLLNNRVYNDLVFNKTIDQKYLILLQTIGEGTARSISEEFSLTVEAEDKCKSIQEGLPFVIDVIRLGMYGGFTEDILNVLGAYETEFGKFGHSGNTKYNYDGTLRYKLESDFSITEFLMIVDSKTPNTLDAHYEAIQSGLVKWTHVQASKSNFPYLTDMYLFNDYLKGYYPESKYLINYDVKITAAALYDNYNENEVNADDTYKGKKILITGTVSSIGVDLLDDGYITLSTGDFGKIRCTLNDKTQAKILKKGIKVTLIGNCEGKILTDIILQACTII